MPTLNILKVLDALHRETLTKQENTDDLVQYKVLVNRIKNEYDSIKPESVPVMTSRYLKNAIKDGYLEKEKKGREAFYRLTPQGRKYVINNQDRLGDRKPWYEVPMKTGLASFVIAPPGAPLFVESHESAPLIDGVEELEEFMGKIKEKNPGLTNMYLRFE